MDQARVERVLAELHAAESSTSVLDRICVVCVRCAGVDGAGLSRVDHGTPELLVASDHDTSLVEQLQIDLAEGPAVEALSSFRRSEHPDLASDDARRRWPKFADAALERGIRAVFAVPLVTGGVGVGAMAMYRRRAGGLGADQAADADVLADLAALAVDQLGTSTSIDAVGLTVEPLTPWSYPAIVHNASGMIAEQLAITVSEALLRLRTLAFANGHSVADIARQVVARDLRIERWGQHG